MKVAIIGCGYVGTAVAQYWQKYSDLSVTATTTTPERVESLKTLVERVVVMQGNDPDGLLSVLKNQDIVLLSIGAKNAAVYRETYLETAQTLVSILPETQVQQIIYTGSYSVYGDRKGAKVEESDPVCPSHENGEILAETEQILLKIATEHLKVCILRLGGIYGPNRELVKIWSRAAGTTRPGDGFDITNWVHLEDIVGVIDFVQQHRLHGIYNFVDNSYLTQRELLSLIYQKHNLPGVSWDATQKNTRAYNAKVSNQKIQQSGYQFIHPKIVADNSAV